MAGWRPGQVTRSGSAARTRSCWRMRCGRRLLRASHGAVLVGAGTVAAADPRLTPRLVEGPAPVRVVVDSTLRLSPSANVVCDGAAPTILATTEPAPSRNGREFAATQAEVLVLPATADGRVDLGALLDEL